MTAEDRKTAEDPKADDPSSPACLAHEADDAYMGFATQAELAVFLKKLADAEGAGQPFGDLLREMLPKVRDDALHRRLTEKLRSHETKIAREAGR